VLSSCHLPGIAPEKANPFGGAPHERAQSGERTKPE